MNPTKSTLPRLGALLPALLFAALLPAALFAQTGTAALPQDKPVIATQSLEPIAMEEAVGDDYVLGPGDFLDVFVENHNYVVQVGPDGSITLEELGAIRAGGMTFGEAKAKIVEALSAKYRKEYCFVSLSKLKQLAIPVSGAVAHPQTLRVNWGMRLSGAVALAGGTAGSADDHRVEIRRGDETKSYDILVAQRTGDLSQDPVLQQGDRVFVPWVDRSKPQVLVGVQDGGVVNAAWDESLALADYLAWAGELGRPSDARAVRVTHADGKVEMVDFAEIGTRKAAPGDRIEMEGGAGSDVYVGGAVAHSGALPYQPSWKVVDYLKAAGVVIVAADVKRVKVIKATGEEKTVSSIDEPVAPGDFIRLDKATIEYIKDWATIITAVISVVYTIVLINETTKD